MSNYQSAKGLYKIPPLSRSSVRKDLLRVYADYRTGVYEECLKCYKYAKQGSSTYNQIQSVKEIAHELESGEYVGLYKYGDMKDLVKESLSDYLYAQINAGQLKKPLKKNFSTMPSLNNDGSRTLYFNTLESSVTIAKNTSNIKIVINENNHNVDRAMKSVIGKVVSLIRGLDTHGAKSGGGLLINDEYVTGQYVEYAVGGVGERAAVECNRAHIMNSELDF